MNNPAILKSLALIKPEIAIAIALCLVLIFDLILKNKKILHYIALISISIVSLFVFNQFAVKTGVAFGLLVVDPVGSFFKSLITVASFLIILFTISSKEIGKVEKRLGEFYVLIFGMILGMYSLVSSVDLISIYVSLELMSLSSYVLAGFTKISLRNSEASLKYLIYGSASSGIMLFGISLIYGMFRSTNLYMINMAFKQGFMVEPIMFYVALIFVLVGIAYKISAVPFHFWTPDVYEGSPIVMTAFLSVASKAAGFALLLRFVYAFIYAEIPNTGIWFMIPNFDWKLLISILSVLSMTIGNFTALWQTNLKRLLAYSSIAHLGYLLLGVVVFSNDGLAAIIMYFVAYMLMNLGAFYVVMTIADHYGVEDLNDYKGLGLKINPILGVSFGIFLISLVGLPPLAGFIPKLYLFSALVSAKMIPIAIIALLNTVVSLYYYVRVLKEMYLSKPEKEISDVKVPYLNYVVSVGLAIPVFILGIYFTPLLNIAKLSLKFFTIQ